MPQRHRSASAFPWSVPVRVWQRERVCVLVCVVNHWVRERLGGDAATTCSDAFLCDLRLTSSVTTLAYQVPVQVQLRKFRSTPLWKVETVKYICETLRTRSWSSHWSNPSQVQNCAFHVMYGLNQIMTMSYSEHSTVHSQKLLAVVQSRSWSIIAFGKKCNLNSEFISINTYGM